MLIFKNRMIFMTSILHYEVIRIEVLGFFLQLCTYFQYDLNYFKF